MTCQKHVLFTGYGLYKAGVFGNAGLLVHGAVIFLETSRWS